MVQGWWRYRIRDGQVCGSGLQRNKFWFLLTRSFSASLLIRPCAKTVNSICCFFSVETYVNVFLLYIAIFFYFLMCTPSSAFSKHSCVHCFLNTFFGVSISPNNSWNIFSPDYYIQHFELRCFHIYPNLFHPFTFLQTPFANL